MPRTSTQLSGKTANSITTLADGEKAARRYLMSDLNTVANNPNNHAINARSIVKDYVRQVTLNQIKTTFAEITGQIEQLTLSDSEKTALLEKVGSDNPTTQLQAYNMLMFDPSRQSATVEANIKVQDSLLDHIRTVCWYNAVVELLKQSPNEPLEVAQVEKRYQQNLQKAVDAAPESLKQQLKTDGKKTHKKLVKKLAKLEAIANKMDESTNTAITNAKEQLTACEHGLNRLEKTIDGIKNDIAKPTTDKKTQEKLAKILDDAEEKHQKLSTAHDNLKTAFQGLCNAPDLNDSIENWQINRPLASTRVETLNELASAVNKAYPYAPPTQATAQVILNTTGRDPKHGIVDRQYLKDSIASPLGESYTRLDKEIEKLNDLLAKLATLQENMGTSDAAHYYKPKYEELLEEIAEQNKVINKMLRDGAARTLSEDGAVRDRDNNNHDALQKLFLLTRELSFINESIAYARGKPLSEEDMTPTLGSSNPAETAMKVAQRSNQPCFMTETVMVERDWNASFGQRLLKELGSKYKYETKPITDGPAKRQEADEFVRLWKSGAGKEYCSKMGITYKDTKIIPDNSGDGYTIQNHTKEQHDAFKRWCAEHKAELKRQKTTHTLPGEMDPNVAAATPATPRSNVSIGANGQQQPAAASPAAATTTPTYNASR